MFKIHRDHSRGQTAINNLNKRRSNRLENLLKKSWRDDISRSTWGFQMQTISWAKGRVTGSNVSILAGQGTRTEGSMAGRERRACNEATINNNLKENFTHIRGGLKAESLWCIQCIQCRVYDFKQHTGLVAVNYNNIRKMRGTRMPVLVWCLLFAPGLVHGVLRDFVLLLALWGAGLGLVRGPDRGTVVSGCCTDDWGFGEGLCTLSAAVQECGCVFRCDCLTRACCYIGLNIVWYVCVYVCVS